MGFRRLNMAYTYSKLAEYTVPSGGVSAITFTNIPQNYTDIKIVASLRTNYTGSNYGYIDLIINGNSGNLTEKRLLGYSAGVSSSSLTQMYAPQDTDAATSNTLDRKSTRLNSSHTDISRMPSSA